MHVLTYIFEIDECVANTVDVRKWRPQVIVTRKTNLLAIVCKIYQICGSGLAS